MFIHKFDCPQDLKEAISNNLLVVFDKFIGNIASNDASNSLRGERVAKMLVLKVRGDRGVRN